MAGKPATSPGPPGSSTLAQLRRSRFLGQQYADVTKLRELEAQHERQAARYQQRISRLNTKIERLRHQATLLREKGQKVLSGVPEIQQEIKQHERTIEGSSGRLRGGPLTSDVTALHYRIRKLQQRVVDLQQKARSLELRAAQRTQKTAELKVKVDRFTEAAHLASQEAAQFRQRADRLQLIAEQDAALTTTPVAAPSATPAPSGAAASEHEPAPPP